MRNNLVVILICLYLMLRIQMNDIVIQIHSLELLLIPMKVIVMLRKKLLRVVVDTWLNALTSNSHTILEARKDRLIVCILPELKLTAVPEGVGVI